MQVKLDLAPSEVRWRAPKTSSGCQHVEEGPGGVNQHSELRSRVEKEALWTQSNGSVCWNHPDGGCLVSELTSTARVVRLGAQLG